MSDGDKKKSELGSILSGIAAIIAALLGSGGIVALLNSGKDTAPSLSLTQPYQSPQSSSHAESSEHSSTNWLNNIVGSYKSEIWSSGSIMAGVTEFRLNTSGVLTGYYEARGQSSVFSGTLSQCQILQVRKIRCRWDDKYGVGILEISFSNNLSSFDGYWALDGSAETHSWKGSR